MMKKIITILLFVSLLFNILILAGVFNKQTPLESPVFGPFELNSELTLQSLVENGYELIDIPCGIPLFGKWKGDTLEYYQVDVDCQSYEGKYVPIELDFEESKMIDTNRVNDNKEVDTSHLGKPDEFLTGHISRFAEEIRTNPYFPFDQDEIKDCYQKVSSKVYQFYMDTIDSLAIVAFINRNNAFIMEELSDWNTQRGGFITVAEGENGIYFVCYLSDESSYYYKNPHYKWQFSLSKVIPPLHMKMIRESKERDKRITEYYGD